MNDKTPDNCYLAQHGELAGSFCYEDGTLLDNFLIGYVRKATPVYHYRFPITVDTTNDSAVMRSYKDDPAEDPILQGCLNRLSPGVAAAVVDNRTEGREVILEQLDGTTLRLRVPESGRTSLDTWIGFSRRLKVPLVQVDSVQVHLTSTQMAWIMAFKNAEDPRWKDDLILLAALTTSTQAQQHLRNALKRLIKGQKRIIRRAHEALSARSGLTETEINTRISKILGRDGGGKP